jgi:hypothetical protein
MVRGREGGSAYRRMNSARAAFIFIGDYFTTPEDEYAVGSQLKWTRDGNDWVLLRGRRRM